MQTDSVRHTISIEQFAAFLDGNLPEADLQAVAAAIDAGPALASGGGARRRSGGGDVCQGVCRRYLPARHPRGRFR